MAKLRWGDDAPRDSTSAKERLVDAAARCFDRFGVLKTTIEDVAAEAKVSRATVYRYFADRDALILAVLVRETLKIGAVVDQAAVAHPDFSDAIVEAVLATIDAVRADHNLAMLMAPDAAGLTTSIAGASEAVWDLAFRNLGPMFDRGRAEGRLRDDIEIAEAIEWTQRIGLSLLSVKGPVERDRAEQARFLRTFLLPALAATPERAMRH